MLKCQTIMLFLIISIPKFYLLFKAFCPVPGMLKIRENPDFIIHLMSNPIRKFCPDSAFVFYCVYY